ncbi:unnamed protein product, partial [marine sediment metagenome]
MTDSFVTQCPHCQTSFRVTHHQLSVARGVVRCGHCLQVFNAAKQLLEQNRASAPELPVPVPAPVPAAPAEPVPAPAITPEPVPRERSMKQGEGFGVVCILEGEQVGKAPPMVASIGCEAVIRDFAQQDNGLLGIRVEGVRR